MIVDLSYILYRVKWLIKTGCFIIVFTIQEPLIHHTKNLDAQVELSPDLTFKVKSSEEKLNYVWWLNNERIRKERYDVSESGVLSIQKFEKNYEGRYKCIISTRSQPAMSVSLEMQLHLTGKEF